MEKQGVKYTNPHEDKSAFAYSAMNTCGLYVQKEERWATGNDWKKIKN